MMYMLFQTEIFPFEYTPVVPMFLLWAMTFIFVILLIDTEMLTKKLNLVILFITLIFGGILLGGIPNLVMPIQQLLAVLVGGGFPKETEGVSLQNYFLTLRDLYLQKEKRKIRSK